MPESPITPPPSSSKQAETALPESVKAHSGHASPFNTEASRIKRSPFAMGAVDEFGIPLNSGAQYDPIPVGVKDGQLAVFPSFLAILEALFLPVAIRHSLGFNPLRPQDAERFEQAIQAFLPQEEGRSKTIKALPHLSKGYYAGQVPEVLFVYAGIPEVEAALIEELAIYAEKMLRMGFILPEAAAIEHTPSLLHDTAIQRAIPCIILVGNGFHYQRFLKAFQSRIDFIALDEEERKRLHYQLLGRVLRGTMASSSSLPLGAATNAEDEVVSVQKVPSVQRPILNVAGGNKQAQRQVVQVFQGSHVAVHVEQTSANAAERLELQQLFDVVDGVLLPLCHTMLQARSTTHKGTVSLKQLQAQWREVIFAIGVHRKAFSVYETVEALRVQPFESIPAHAQFVLNELREFIPALHAYCLKHNLLNNATFFEHILKALKTDIQA